MRGVIRWRQGWEHYVGQVLDESYVYDACLAGAEWERFYRATKLAPERYVRKADYTEFMRIRVC